MNGAPVDRKDSGAVALLIQECEGLKAGDFEGFAAADVHTGEFVVAANHIGLRLCELGAVALVGVAWKLSAFAAHHPCDFVLAWLSTLGTGEVVGSCFGGFVEEVAFFHVSITL